MASRESAAQVVSYRTIPEKEGEMNMENDLTVHGAEGHQYTLIQPIVTLTPTNVSSTGLKSIVIGNFYTQNNEMWIECHRKGDLAPELSKQYRGFFDFNDLVPYIESKGYFKKDGNANKKDNGTNKVVLKDMTIGDQIELLEQLIKRLRGFAENANVLNIK